MTHIDCFAGPGGICTGVHAAGMDTLVAIEYIKSCCDTYTANHPEVHVIHSDIRKVTANEILPYIPAEGVDIVSSGMPCETFSTAGNTSRSFYDDRQFLFREGIRIAEITNAKMILFENVPGITSKTVEKGSSKLIIDVLKDELRAAGYGNYIEVILDATKYGVPQKRNRYFILACRYDWELSAPEEIEDRAISFEELWKLRQEAEWDDLMLIGTDFQKQVWRKLWELTHPGDADIPAGRETQLICYSDFAELCQNRAGVRAVAHAIGLNPISVIIPCHLVIPKESIDKMNEINRKAETTIFKGDDLCLSSILNDNSIDFGEYALGRKLKRELIKMELA